MTIKKWDLLKPRLWVLTCVTLACTNSFCGTKVASMDPKWDHMGLEKAPSLWMESVHKIFMRTGVPRGEISVCLQSQRVRPTCICLQTRVWSEETNPARGTGCGRGDQSSVQLPQLLFTAVSSVYTIFAVWFCRLIAVDVSPRYFPSLGGRGQLAGLMRSRGRQCGFSSRHCLDEYVNV